MGEWQPDGADGRRGLFDGFEGYRTPVGHDYLQVMTQGLIVLDTNVLLDLCRMNHRVRRDMITVLESVRDRLWIPHQVLEEFWRNQQQQAILRHHKDRAGQARDALSKARESITQTINRWARDVHLGEDAPAWQSLMNEREALARTLDAMCTTIDDQAASDEVPGSDDTNSDPVIGQLEILLQGRVGLPMSPAERREAVAVARTRADAKRPPGYRDFELGKPDDDAAGDYLVWKQLLAEAERRGTDVLFVTRDLKEDWWRPGPHGSSRLPRIELVAEMRETTARHLFMLEPSGLMKEASRIFHLGDRVDERSVQALEQLESTQPDGGASRWDADGLEALIDLLLEIAGVQAQSILEAALNGGFVSRETIYKIGGYPDSRMLRGFTRPVKTAARRLQSQGVPTGDESDLLEPVYDNGGVATGFRIPAYAVPILKVLAEREFVDGDHVDDDGIDDTDESPSRSSARVNGGKGRYDG